ncbi:hypothetical protein J1N35_040516 [Gossypium stocksii]|uniref:Uncharacterized protein n=1 Tax=Gossypium stocksii TaxID=47602 RepID=A0A9D3ZIK7_9ROSI|nr:hypothetical protein J1N35_040516 [Gossypium stocksii]
MSTLPLAGVGPPAPGAPTPPTPSDPTPPTHSQTVTSKASASSPPAPSTQPTPPTMPTSSTQQILTRLCSKEKQVVQGIRLYPDERIGMQILNPGMRGETMVTAPTKCTSKKKGSINKKTTDGIQESSNIKKAKSQAQS